MKTWRKWRKKVSKRNCRRTDNGRARHGRATRIRRMTDAQLCQFIDDLEAGNRPAAPNKSEIIEQFLDDLAIRSDTGLRVSDATIRKIRQIANDRGYIQ